MKCKNPATISWEFLFVLNENYRSEGKEKSVEMKKRNEGKRQACNRWQIVNSKKLGFSF